MSHWWLRRRHSWFFEMASVAFFSGINKQWGLHSYVFLVWASVPWWKSRAVQASDLIPLTEYNKRISKFRTNVEHALGIIWESIHEADHHTVKAPPASNIFVCNLEHMNSRLSGRQTFHSIELMVTYLVIRQSLCSQYRNRITMPV